MCIPAVNSNNTIINYLSSFNVVTFNQIVGVIMSIPYDNVFDIGINRSALYTTVAHQLAFIRNNFRYFLRDDDLHLDLLNIFGEQNTLIFNFLHVEFGDDYETCTVCSTQCNFVTKYHNRMLQTNCKRVQQCRVTVDKITMYYIIHINPAHIHCAVCNKQLFTWQTN